MTSAFLPRHRAVPLTLMSHVSNNGDTEPESAQEELEAVETEMSKRTPACIRILAVDDHEIVRKGICTMLREEDGFEVVGETGTGNMVITLAMQLQPDIVLLDIFLGTSNGLDIALQLQRACPETRIVILTSVMDEGHLFRAMRMGVHGYLQKALPLNDLLAALHAVHRGERVIGEPRAFTQVLGEFSRITKE